MKSMVHSTVYYICCIAFFMSMALLGGFIYTNFSTPDVEKSKQAVTCLGFTFALTGVTFSYSRGLEKTTVYWRSFEAAELFFAGSLCFAMAAMISLGIAESVATGKAESLGYMKFIFMSLLAIGYVALVCGFFKLMTVLMWRMSFQEFEKKLEERLEKTPACTGYTRPHGHPGDQSTPSGGS